jgi:hypothetical protein
MKWNDRLKSVLTEAIKGEFSEKCLEKELRITAKSQKSGVSAVIHSGEFRHFSENQTNPGEAVKSQKTADCLEKELTKADKSHKGEVFAVNRSANSRHLTENHTFYDENEKQVFLEDCLEKELRITAKTPVKVVSAVIHSGYSRDSFKKTDELADFQADYFHDSLNRFIEAGITFDVSADDFLFIDTAQILKISDMEFLNLNSAAILCQLQQSLLMKHLFSHSPFLLEDFAFEIKERESIMTETAGSTYELYCLAVSDVTQSWFERLVNEPAFSF